MDDLINETRTLKNTDINLSLAKQEFLTSPLYKDSLVNKDFTVSSIIIHLHQDPEYFTLLDKTESFTSKTKTLLLLMKRKTRTSMM